MFPAIKATFGWTPLIDKDTYNEAIKNTKANVTLINNHLNGKDFLVGNRLTVADLVLGLSLTHAFTTFLDAGFRKAMGNATKWIEHIIANEAVISKLGKIKLAVKTLPPHLAETKKEEVKAAPAKKEDKPAEKEKKDENPLDVLPPSTFNMFDFKTFFVNHPNKREEGMKAFFEQFDKEGYSIWELNYEMYEGEGVVLYQTVNLMNGFL
jgi:elongation factor 1-gamma